MPSYGVTNFRNVILPAYQKTMKRRAAKVVINNAAQGDSVACSEELEIKSRYFLEFLRTGALKINNDPMSGFETAANKYEELLAEISEKYADNEEERAKHTSALREVLEGHLKSIAQQPFFMALQREMRSGQNSGLHPGGLYGDVSSYERTLEQSAINVKILEGLRDNFLKIASELHKEIINGIGINDGEDSPAGCISKLQSRETTSFDNISLNDMLSVISKINEKNVGLTRIYNEIMDDEGINNIIRDEIAIILGS